MGVVDGDLVSMPADEIAGGMCGFAAPAFGEPPHKIVHSHGMRWRQMTFRAALNYGTDSRTLTSTPLYSNTTMAVFLPTMYSGGCASIIRPSR